MSEIQSRRFVGLLDLECNPSELAVSAGEDVRSICEMSLGVAPKVIVEGHQTSFPYFSTHIHYILCELLKNSATATVKHHGMNKSEKDLPPITVTIANGQEDVTIRVSGHGGGIPRSSIKKVFKYSYTTADSASPLAGYGTHLVDAEPSRLSDGCLTAVLVI